MTLKARTPNARSRRERPAKPALSRSGIVEAALAILREEGLEKVTMRRIASALDTGPSSLYVYVRDTADLHAQILDALLAPLTGSPPAGHGWQARLGALLTRYRDVLFTYPEIARMTLVTQPSGPHYLALVDAVLGLLQEGGVAGREAAWAVDLLLLYATATAAEQSTRRGSPQAAGEFSALASAILTADAGSFPHIARLGDDLLSGGSDRFAWGLDVLLSGVVRAQRPT